MVPAGCSAVDCVGVAVGAVRYRVRRWMDNKEGPGRFPKMSDLSTLADQRGLKTETLTDANIHWDDNKEAWAIPYPHRTGTWKTRWRNTHPYPKYEDAHGAAFHLYNPQKLGPGEEEIWFAEGEFDTLCLIEQGYNAIGIHGVSNVPSEERWSDENPTGFKREWKLLFEDSRVIVMFDNDDPGRKAGRRLARALGGEAFDAWDDEYVDINEWHRADPEGLGVAIDRFRYRIFGSEGMA